MKNKKEISNKLKQLKKQYNETFETLRKIEEEGARALGYEGEEIEYPIDWLMDYYQDGLSLKELFQKIPDRSHFKDGWEIKCFGDYHEIYDYKEDKYINRAEIGFNGYYIGLFWNGKLPPKKQLYDYTKSRYGEILDFKYPKGKK